MWPPLLDSLKAEKPFFPLFRQIQKHLQPFLALASLELLRPHLMKGKMGEMVTLSLTSSLTQAASTYSTWPIEVAQS